ncbi:MAG: polyprenol monophosphomannose synthase [Candidatus Hydrogenedentes bacterium]|nr:polyprenol monophosphomannose synthase [Candidatus Hydrogenedentota bacterium]
MRQTGDRNRHVVRAVVVIPTYNEADNIEPLIRAIQHSAPGTDVVVVDDGSPDGTAALARALDGVHVIERPAKLGLGTAYIAGFTYAIERGYDRIGGMDADFSHDPAVLPALFALLDTCDIGIGARYVPRGGTRNWGFHRRALSRIANLVARLMLAMPAHDVTSGYRCYRREVLESIHLDSLKSQGYAFLVELLYRAFKQGATIGETPIIFEDRRHGVSKINKSEIWRGITNLFRLRFRP